MVGPAAVISQFLSRLALGLKSAEHKVSAEWKQSTVSDREWTVREGGA